MNMTFSGLKTKLFSLGKKSQDTSPAKSDMGILDHIEKIVEISQKYGIDRCRNKGKYHFEYVTQKLGINPTQALLFSHFIERSDDHRILTSEIAESIHCSKVRIIKYLNDCDELVKKRLIRCSRREDGISFRVPREVLDGLRKNNEFHPEKNENISIDKFFSLLERFFQERADDELDYEELKVELLDLIKTNMHLMFCKKIISYKLDEDDMLLLICFCHLAGNNNDDNIGPHDFEFLYEDKSHISYTNRELSTGEHILIQGKYITHNNEDGFVNSESWKLSDMAKKELLSELSGLGKKNFKKNLIMHDSIKVKNMFYNIRETNEIKKLTSLLREENYSKIRDRLDGKGMRAGFACLFSGGPGTGKTETAYQIARETGRNIMMVNIADTKSCWYGESEKKIKEIFDTYRTAVENSETFPILLFNEADAVIGKRKSIGGANHSIDQTENTIQNIILQEMENLSGIMIATTNLSQNMDTAFERRFLYKINFDKPDQKSRAGIWSSQLPDLPEDWIAELSKRFELSGGQIENIARKTEVDGILSGKKLSLDNLTQYCKDETQNGFTVSTKIGFANE
ncbi:MAG: ATP-binding protein [Spirochaetaceae bacterium]|jgi:hypothetical protein|nr:ATP-binding protein [Spirochaetaceae bacterium]